MHQKHPAPKAAPSAVRTIGQNRPKTYRTGPNPVVFAVGAFVAIAVLGGTFMAVTGAFRHPSPSSAAVSAPACKEADCVKKRDKIVISYTGTLSDGRVFESSSDGGRMGGAVIEVAGGGPPPGFHRAILGMKTGESKTFTVPFREAYGPKYITVEYVKSAFGKDLDKLKEGSEYEIMPGMKVKILKIGDKTVSAEQKSTHWLAGEDLKYSVKIEKNLGPTSGTAVTAPQPVIVGASKGNASIADGPPTAREDSR